MHGRLSVELADLRGWADQVGRAGGHCRDLVDYHAAYVPDGDFGRILELIRPEYEQCAVQVRHALGRDAVVLDATGSALRKSAHTYAGTDSQVARSLGGGAAVVDGATAAGAFRDRGVTAPVCPSSRGVKLPELTFGWALDEVFRLADRAWGWDIRAELTWQIAGDVGKALAQAEAWENAGAALGAVEDNIARGATLMSTAWEGRASTVSHGHVLAWVRSLEAQSGVMTRVAGYLRDAVDLAVAVAQAVVDLFKEITYVVTAGIGFANIPIYGELRAVRALRDVWRLLNDARKVLRVFWEALVVLKDCLRAAVTGLTAESLPQVPKLPASASAA